MTLQDIFDDLAFGELSQLAIGGADSGTPTDIEQICEKDRPALIKHINLGLNALYRRFRLAEKSVVIILQENKSSYVLDSRFAITNTQSNEPVKYLLDVNDEFDDTLLKVEEVQGFVSPVGAVDRSGWIPLKLNATNNPHSLRTPSMKTLIVPDDFGMQTPPEKILVKYRASHPKIDVNLGTYAAMEQIIELPSTHLAALLYFVASRVMNPVGMVEEFHSGNSYYAKYDAECRQLEGENFQIDDMEENSNFHRQGFI